MSLPAKHDPDRFRVTPGNEAERGYLDERSRYYGGEICLSVHTEDRFVSFVVIAHLQH